MGKRHITGRTYLIPIDPIKTIVTGVIISLFYNLKPHVVSGDFSAKRQCTNQRNQMRIHLSTPLLVRSHSTLVFMLASFEIHLKNIHYQTHLKVDHLVVVPSKSGHREGSGRR